MMCLGLLPVNFALGVLLPPAKCHFYTLLYCLCVWARGALTAFNPVFMTDMKASESCCCD